MAVFSFRIRLLCCLGILVFLISASVSSAQSSFDGSRECYELNAKMGSEDAVRFWTGPAEAGDRQAQFCLGLTIYPSRMVGHAPDRGERARQARTAMDWILRSAEQGFAPAQERLGQAYATGDAPFGGVAQDLDKATHWTQKAADQGMPIANLSLAQWYGRGEAGLPQDKLRAYRHLRLSVELFRVQMDPSEFQGLMPYFGLGEQVVFLARELKGSERTEADAWVKLQVQKYLKDTNASPQSGSYTVVANKYIAEVQSGVAKETGGQVLIEVEPDIEITVRGDCFSQEERCRVVIFWFYAKADSVAFSGEAFSARNIKDQNIEYGSMPIASAKSWCQDNCGSDREVVGTSMSVLLNAPMPQEFVFVMPKLNVNGKEKEMPVIYFKHVQIVEELVPLY